MAAVFHAGPEKKLIAIGDTRSKAIGYRVAYPDMDMVEIARYIGVTTERVRQTLKEADLPTITPKIYRCKICGEQIEVRYSRSMLCRVCFKNKQWVILECEVCGIKFSRAKWKDNIAKKHNYQHVFCSKQCQGNWLGSNYGFRNKGGVMASELDDLIKVIENDQKTKKAIFWDIAMFKVLAIMARQLEEINHSLKILSRPPGV